MSEPIIAKPEEIKPTVVNPTKKNPIQKTAESIFNGVLSLFSETFKFIGNITPFLLNAIRNEESTVVKIFYVIFLGLLYGVAFFTVVGVVILILSFLSPEFLKTVNEILQKSLEDWNQFSNKLLDMGLLHYIGVTGIISLIGMFVLEFQKNQLHHQRKLLLAQAEIQAEAQSKAQPPKPPSLPE